MRKQFESGINVYRTRSFPEADIGSDHDLMMMTFRVRVFETVCKTVGTLCLACDAKISILPQMTKNV